MKYLQTKTVDLPFYCILRDFQQGFEFIDTVLNQDQDNQILIHW